ncbi:MAG: hypothetical protein Fur0025_27150 [Oscillatoriaceae cyanobacterium]
MAMNTSDRDTPSKPRPLVLALMLTGALLLQAYPGMTNRARAGSDPMVLARKILFKTGVVMAKMHGQEGVPLAVSGAVRRDLSQKLGIPISQLKITASSPENWPDTCLGMGAADEVCGQMMVSGWQVVVANHWVYRTDDTGRKIVLENRNAPVGYLPEAVKNAVLAAVEPKLAMDAPPPEFSWVEWREWENSCLGLTGAAPECGSKKVTGWVAIVSSGPNRWVYRTDDMGKTVLLDAELSATDGNLETASLPIPVLQAVKMDLAKAVGIPPEELQLREFTPQTWSDLCLGMGKSEKECTRSSVDGWRIVLSAGDTSWAYRTDAKGEKIKLEDALLR